jgi:ABC-type nitrate/sulfonate/bicarbonate transport system substrate-binding protein
MTHTLTLALDWTPNTNHIGCIIAKELGFYQAQGIDLQLLSPAQDNYQVTPGKKLALGLADLAIAPFETVISLNNKPDKVNAIAIFALLQEDLSSIACLAETGIGSPKNLDGKTYASYKARYEDAIVKQMVIQDGGQGQLNLIYPDKLGIWNTLLTHQAHVTWIFDNWEGVAAEHQKVLLHKFRLSDFGIPYGYSPVMLTTQEKLQSHAAVYKSFAQATKQGYLYAQQNLAEASDILAKYLPAHELETIPILQSLQMTAPYFGTAATCGQMKDERVKAFLQWLVDHQLEQPAILTQTLYTNMCLENSGLAGAQIG